MTSSDDGNSNKKLDPVPLWIMGVIVLVVIGIIIYGP